jgi:hypothetical protein
VGSEARDELLSTFFQLAGETGGTSTGFGLGPEALSTAAATVAGATVKGGGAAKTESNADGGVTAGSVAKSVLESGLGIVPLVTGLFGLFGGSTEEAAPPLQKYAMPQAISFESADSGGRLVASDRDQTGAPRVYQQQGGSGEGSTAVGQTAGGPQITVNVQAMDAKSFMDHSSEIAQAVRGAMLNMSSINDVLGEL